MNDDEPEVEPLDPHARLAFVCREFWSTFKREAAHSTLPWLSLLLWLMVLTLLVFESVW